MSRRAPHARPDAPAPKAPAVVEESAPAAPVVPLAAAVPLPFIVPAPPPPVAEVAPDAVAELAAVRAQLANAEAMLDQLTGPTGAVRRPFVAHAGLRFRGRDYESGDAFPFDPLNPPDDVSGSFVEGLHYVYR